jgi:outer membrane receptor protein involved in Fe transport
MTYRAMLCGMAAVGALLVASPVLSATQKVNLDAQQEFKIPGQPLDTALLLYSRESGLQIISSAPVVANKLAQPLHGRMTPREALNLLLRGSDLSFVVSGSTVTIVPSSPARGSGLAPIALQSQDAMARAGAMDERPALAATPSPIEGGVAAADPSDQVSTVTVTGSHIVRNGYEAPTPVTVALVEDLQLTTPSNIPDALNKLPEFSGSITQNSNNNSTVSVSGNFLNLRGLGPARTLVLMDGHRLPPTSYNGTVDTNTLPQLLTKRVEVVTGGASAIYGSDAVGGVVNFILDTKFTGFKGMVQGGVSTYGDARSSRLGFAWGAPVLGDAGHVLFSFSHATQDGLDQSARSYSAADQGYTGTGTAANPYTLNSNLRLAATTFGGYVTSGPLKGQQFVGSGTIAPFTAGAATGSTTIQSGGDGAYYYNMQMLKPLQTDQLFGRFSYDFANGVSAFGQVSAGWSETNFVSSSVVLNTTMYGNNAYLPAAVATTVGPNGSFGMSSLLQDLALDGGVEQKTQDITFSTGLQGKFLKDAFKWDVYYAHGEGMTSSTSRDNINTSHLYAALDAVKAPDGSIVCRVSTTSSASLYPGCAPLDIFGVGNESAAALGYIFQDTSWRAQNKMDDVSATISGTAFNNWAGPVSIATNVEWRSLSLDQTTNANPNTLPTITGLRATWSSAASPFGKAPTPTNPFLYGTVAPQHGEQSVWEASFETIVPLLKDKPFAQALDLDAAYRYTEYSATGPAKTWKVGLNYRPFSDLRFRATQSHDIRAPNLYELFQAPTYGSVTITDPHTLLNGSVTSESVGNPDLKPEVADTTTAGVIYSPSWFPHFKISLDYYHINIANVVATTTGLGGSPSTALANCESSGGTSSQCLAIVRPLPFSNTTAANFPTLILTESINLARQYNTGADLEASYSFELADIRQNLPGRADLRVIFNYAPEQVIITNPGQPSTNAAGNGVPTGRATGMFNYDLGPFKASWQTTYAGSHRQGTGVPGQVFAGGDYPALITHDLGLNYHFNKDGRKIQAFLSVNNIFNQMPQISPLAPTNSPGQTSSAVGDTRGRFFTTGVRFSY